MFCAACGSPQRQLVISGQARERFTMGVFPDEVAESTLKLTPSGHGEVEIRWELERDSREITWLRLPQTEDRLPCGRDSLQRILAYGARLPEGGSHVAHLRLHHTTRQGSRLGNDRLWDRWCWDVSKVSVEVLKKSPAFLTANGTRRDLGRLSQVAQLHIPQLFRLGNGGDRDLHLVLASGSRHLRLSQSHMTLLPGQTCALEAELHLLDLTVGEQHESVLTITSEEEDATFTFMVTFELQYPRVELPVLGVDFGTSSSKVALLGDGQIQQVRLDGKELFPSHLYLYPDGRMIIGEEASEFRGEPNYLRNLKSLMGGDTSWVEVMDPNTGERTRHDLHALVAGFLRRLFRKARDSADFEKYVGKGVNAEDIRLVLTIPAGSSPDARAETERVMKRILERLGFAEVSILVEPTAVSFLYAAEDPEMVEGKRILVFDCGAGTTDVSLLKVRLARDPEEGFYFRRFDILGEAGEMIGGNLFDVALYDRLAASMGPKSKELLRRLLWQQQHGNTGLLEPPANFPGTRKLRSQHLLEAIRATKEELSAQWSSAQASFPIHCPQALDPSEPLALDRPTLVKALRPFFDKLDALCARVLKGAQLEEDDVDRVYLVGGSSFLPPLKALLTRMFGVDRIITDSGRLTSISRGAVASASTRIRKVLTVDYLLRVPGLPDQLLVGAGAIYPTREKTRVFLAPSSPPFLVKFQIIRRVSELAEAGAVEELLGDLPVRVDSGPSREISLRYEVDLYGDLTIAAEYRNEQELFTFPVRYPRPSQD
jgi:molecular chaperone DnaK